MDATLEGAGLLSRARSLTGRRRGKRAVDEPPAAGGAGPAAADKAAAATAAGGAGPAAADKAAAAAAGGGAGAGADGAAAAAGGGAGAGAGAAAATAVATEERQDGAGLDRAIADGEVRATPAMLQPPAWALPVRLRGRDELLRRLAGLLWSPDGSAHVLAGAAGTGKTSCALWLARRAQSRGMPVWWVPASDPRMMMVRLLDLAADIGAGPGEVAQARAGLRDPADLLWRYLEKRAPWLLVFDGADAGLAHGGADSAGGNETAGDAGGTAGTGGTDSAASWLRRTQCGLILVTSADERGWGPTAELHDVGPLDPMAGGQALIDLAPRAGSARQAAELSQRLGGLPLALRLAGSLLATGTGPEHATGTGPVHATGTGPEHASVTTPGDPAGTADWRTFAGYAGALDERGGLDGRGAAGARGDRDSRAIVAAARELALEALAAGGRPQARALLRVLCCLAPSALIPTGVLDMEILGRACDGDTWLANTGLANTGLANKELAKKGLRALSRVGLIASQEAGVTVHRLVSEGSRVYTGDAARSGGIAAAMIASAAARNAPDTPDTPDAPDALGVVAELQPHISALYGYLGGVLGTGDLAALTAAAAAAALAFLHAGSPVTAAGLAADALRYGGRLGADHPAVLSLRNTAARARAQQSPVDAPERELRELLAAQVRVLGPEHPDTLGTGHQLAMLLARLGRYEPAEQQLRNLLAARARTLGPDHPSTLATRHDFGLVLAQRGQYAQAAREFGELFAARVRLLGPGHRDTQVTRRWLAHVVAADATARSG